MFSRWHRGPGASGFTYHKTEEVAHVGPVRATVNEEKVVHVPVIACVSLLISGLGLAVVGAKCR